MKTKLKPCPFCGRIPEIWDEEEDAPGGPVVVDHYMDCRCGLRLCGLGASKEDLIKSWNTRKRI